MTNVLSARYSAAVIGAGPAGLFAARELASRGIATTLLNRDIKPGGLAEYGIYPSKLRMKEGLRNQFRQILGIPDLSYFGNVLVGEQGDITLADLRALGFQALLVTVGAQSTKKLGIPGEELTGVYHAKDIVYHYNLLPPFSERTYQIGKRVAVVGAGNVMMDITRWLIEDQGAQEVIAVARRGPAEVKFDRKELETLIRYVDLPALEAELGRVAPMMRAVQQDPGEFRRMIDETDQKAGRPAHEACFSMRFLASPAKILGENGRVTALEIEENELALGQDGQTRARGTGKHTAIPLDCVIFAIGDIVDPTFGLPVEYGEYLKNPQPRFPVEGLSYEAYDPQSGQPIADVFLAGWARRPSTGLVGVARKDGTNAAQVVEQYLHTLEPQSFSAEMQLRERLAMLDHPVIDKDAVLRLEILERDRAQALNLPYFKFASNQDMLEALGLSVPLKK